MTAFTRIASLKVQGSDNDNRMVIEWAGVSYAINQRTLNRYTTAAEIKAALDKWAQVNLGYVINDIWFHKNRDGSWAVATGEQPAVWPEDEVTL